MPYSPCFHGRLLHIVQGWLKSPGRDSLRLLGSMQGINAIIFYAPVLFEQIAGGATGSLLSTVVVDVGESPAHMCTHLTCRSSPRCISPVSSGVAEADASALRAGLYLAVNGPDIPFR